MEYIAQASVDLTVSTGDRNWDFFLGLITPIGHVNDVMFWLENVANIVAGFLWSLVRFGCMSFLKV